MYWFILLFPLLIFPWGIERYYTLPKFYYLELFVLITWLSIIIKRRTWEINLKKPYLSLELIVFLFLILIGLSTIFSVNQYVSIYGRHGRHEGLLAFLCYGSVLLFSYKLIPYKKLEKVIPGMAIVSIIVSIYGIFQHYYLDFLPRSPVNYKTNRSYAFFDNPNFFGSYLVIVIMLTIVLFLNARNRGHSVFYLITICISYIALIFSGTRSGWLGVFFGVLFISCFVILKRKYLWKKWAILISAWVILFFGINAIENGSYFARMNTMLSDSYKVVTDKSTGKEGSHRLIIWKKSFPLVKDYFWLGSGPDTFDRVFPNDEEKRKFFGEMIVDKAHNEYLQIAVTLGVPALLTYLYLLFIVLRNAFLALRKADEQKKIVLYGLISCIFGYLVQAFFNISTVPVAPLFWALLGVTMSLSAYYLKNEADSATN